MLMLKKPCQVLQDTTEAPTCSDRIATSAAGCGSTDKTLQKDILPWPIPPSIHFASLLQLNPELT